MKVAVKSGQAMLEYVLVLAGVLVVVAVLWVLVGAVVHHGERTRALVAADYP